MGSLLLISEKVIVSLMPLESRQKLYTLQESHNKKKDLSAYMKKKDTT